MKNIDDAEKDYIEQIDRGAGGLCRRDWYKRMTVRKAFRNGWKQALETKETANLGSTGSLSIEVYLLSQSEPIVYPKVINAYIKESMYCIEVNGSVDKYPLVNIFRVREI